MTALADVLAFSLGAVLVALGIGLLCGLAGSLIVAGLALILGALLPWPTGGSR